MQIFNNMETKIIFGEKKVIDAGSVVAPINDIISFSLQGVTLCMKIEIIDKADATQSSFDISPDIQENKLLITLRIHSDTKNAVSHSIDVASKGSLILQFLFCLHFINSSVCVINFAWFV